MRIEKNKIITGSLVAITAFSFAALTLPSVLADDGFVDVITINVPVSCSLVASGMNTHTATIQNGNTTSDIGTTNVKVTCNDNTGYALYAIGYTNDEYGNNKLTNATLGSTHDIITATTVTTGTSSWAMKLTKTTNSYTPIIAGSTDDTNRQTGDPDFSGYTAVPNEYTKVAYFPSSTDIGSGASGSNLTTTYRAYISQTQPAGTYIGQVKYTLVHPSTAGKPVTPLKASDCPAGYVCYAPNASDIVGSMDSLGSISSSPTAGKISVGTSATTINLIAPNYKREGYGFAGWSKDFTATNASTIYGPNETLTVPSTTLATKGMILYPVWVASTGTLQSFSCANSGLTPASYNSTTGKISATLSSITALTDARDGNTYAVAKLADGQCWMIENLRLNSEHTTSSGDIALAEGYGNATTSINAGGNDLGKFVGLAGSEDANFADNTTANSLYSIDGTNGTININSKSGYYPVHRLPRYNKNNTNMAPNATNSDGTTSLVTSYNANDNHSRWYGYGNYYNWPAAMANTEYYTTYSGNNGSDAAGTSICPSNWHLPLGYTSTGELDNQEASSTWRVGGFSYLDRKMGGTGTSSSTNSVTGASMSSLWRSFPNNFVYSGYWNGARAYNRSSVGSYWSSSAFGSNRAYGLGLVSSNVNPGTGSSDKVYGFAVRCVAGS